MASKRDLVEAHDFNRRRLVTAFLSGAPGGREVEPVRYGRTIIGGLVLAGILVAGAAVTGVLKPTVSDDWRDNGLVIGKESGSRFLMYDDELYPVANIASARLAIKGKLKISYVPDDILVKEPKRNAIGILNAPDYIPPANRLVQEGWTACTNADGGLRTVVDTSPGAKRSSGSALVVRSRDDAKYWIVTGTHRYPVPPDGETGRAILRALGLDRTTAFPAPNSWLELIPVGSPIAAFSVPDIGQPVDQGVEGLQTIGTPVDVGGSKYVLAKGGLVPLSEFAYEVYLVSPNGHPEPQTLDPADLGRLKTLSEDRPYPADWPGSVPSPYTDTTPCLLLERGEDPQATSRAHLAAATDQSVAPSGSTVTSDVQQGRGALVYGTTRATGGPIDTAFLIDSLATRYAIGPKNSVQDAQSRLGYAGVAPVPVPRSWTELFRDGPALDVDRAGAPVADARPAAAPVG
ncbi:type VII secretion protein EccB [Aeromicrobium chenweiae]|uniref:Type VII secretion protein EccB n=1 Tax=Aeromicrobium chenweiae TaxID=2079793 RepID=A0A2S0WQV8_9ACTN|nr:type VII secretion protein EccB [Aeromicrobium chenweiae]AWB93614.1 type VII secretion protein EccB [Aeromicrobium chenweiae]TGN33263.1 type VII secretion protein EccB [Aeromicrobium chenweiae]